MSSQKCHKNRCCSIQAEVCDGKDNNCDGIIDNISDLNQGCNIFNRRGICQEGKWACLAYRKVCQQIIFAISESCNGKDDDCDGVTDEGRLCFGNQECKNGRCVSKCGNGQVDSGENCSNCSADVKCSSGQSCVNGRCQCVPNCTNKSCGSNGCGGICGYCNWLQYCQNGQCRPKCGNGKVDSGENCSNCRLDVKCLPSQYCQNGQCRSKCGNGQVDVGETCSNCSQDVRCLSSQYCNNGLCVSKCGNGQVDSGENCSNCPADVKCSSGQSCVNGRCQCMPNCTNKSCGSNGCGGSCGFCNSSQYCSNGRCVSKCGNGQIDPGETCSNCSADVRCGGNQRCYNNQCCTRQCNGKNCGSDACGGLCGQCLGKFTCQSGTCVDVTCPRQCSGKQCGPDGCGGSCGSCPTGKVCNTANWQCEGVCNRQCLGKQCGPDKCGKTCGTCSSGKQCNSTGQCVATSTCNCNAKEYCDKGTCKLRFTVSPTSYAWHTNSAPASVKLGLKVVYDGGTSFTAYIKKGSAWSGNKTGFTLVNRWASGTPCPFGIVLRSYTTPTGSYVHAINFDLSCLPVGKRAKLESQVTSPLSCTSLRCRFNTGNVYVTRHAK